MAKTSKFNFGSIVIVEDCLIGVVVKVWENLTGIHEPKGFNYDVYVRSWNTIVNYHENKIKHFIYDKEIE